MKMLLTFIFLMSLQSPKKSDIPAPVIVYRYYEAESKTEIELLARVIHSESCTTHKGRVAVGNIVQNRMEEDNQTLLTVILQPGQFDGSYCNSFRKTPCVACLDAAADVLQNGARVLPKRFRYFLNPETATDRKMLAMARKSRNKILIDNQIYF